MFSQKKKKKKKIIISIRELSGKENAETQEFATYLIFAMSCFKSVYEKKYSCLEQIWIDNECLTNEPNEVS